MTVTMASSTPLGSYTLTITGTSGSLIRTTTVTLTVGTNLALGKPAVGSSLEAAQYPAGAPVDGNLTTRWSSQFSNPQWIYVDLGATYNINRVKLVWEAAYGKPFQIQVSTDATNWTNVYSTTANTALTNDVTASAPPNTTWRYVRYERPASWAHLTVILYMEWKCTAAKGLCQISQRRHYQQRFAQWGCCGA